MSVFKSCFGDTKSQSKPTSNTTKDNDAEPDFTPKPLERRETAYDRKMRQADERKAREDDARKARLGKSKAYTSSEPLPYSKLTTTTSKSALPVVAPTSGTTAETTNYAGPNSNMMVTAQGGLVGEMTQPNHAHVSGGPASMGGGEDSGGADAVGY